MIFTLVTSFVNSHAEMRECIQDCINWQNALLSDIRALTKCHEDSIKLNLYNIYSQLSN